MTEIEMITLVVEATQVLVQPGCVDGSKLWFQASGLDIYIIGDKTAKRHHAVAYVATLETVARHIPARTLRFVGRRVGRRDKRVLPGQGRLF